MSTSLNLSLSLPQPTKDEQARSDACLNHINTVIEQSEGRIPFSQFMDLALYTPDLGYYASKLAVFGPQGDFVTAPELTPLFGRCLARQYQQIAAHLRKIVGKHHTVDLLELGAGSGKLAADLLLSLAHAKSLPDHYYILELSKTLQKRQADYLKKRCPHLLNRVIFLNELPQDPFTGVIIANEVLDALPVERFTVEAGLVKQHWVSRSEEGLSLRQTKATDALSNALSDTALCQLHSTRPYTSEINVGLPNFLKALNECLAEGVMLFIDYGYVDREYYHPDRKEGTLSCYYKHHQHSNPLILTGLQDISAHVNFSLLAKQASKLGLCVDGFCNQANFLLSSGLPEFFSQAKQPNLAATQTLMLPGEMGEACKVIALSKRYDEALLGFALQDRRSQL